MSSRTYHVLSALSPGLARHLAQHTGFGRRIVETKHGTFSVDPLSALGDSLIRLGEFEPHMIDTFRRFVAPDSVVLDLGANEGFFTVVASALCTSGRVVAVEPQPACAVVVRKNIELNRCTNAHLWQGAVMDRDGTVDLFVHPATNSGATSVAKSSPLAFRSLRTPCLTLDALCTRHGIESVDFVKMDIEGAEYEAVLGSPGLFKAGRVRALALEYHPDILERRSKSAAEIDAMLTNCGMRRMSEQPHAVYVRP